MKFPAALMLVSLAFLGCSSPKDPWMSRGDRVMGLESERAEDPVTGTLVLKQSAVKREYRGAIYYFESTETAGIFDRNPAHFAIIENVPPGDRADRDVR